MAPPAGFKRAFLPIAKPNFVKAGFSLSNLGDLLFGLFFTAVSLSIAIPIWEKCFGNTLDARFFEKAPCLGPIIFPVFGLGMVVYHFRERKREGALVDHGQLAMGIVTKAPVGRQKTVEFEFSTATGERMEGSQWVTTQEYDVADDILVIYDPVKPKIHRPVASLRFYQAQDEPWNRL